MVALGFAGLVRAEPIQWAFWNSPASTCGLLPGPDSGPFLLLLGGGEVQIIWRNGDVPLAVEKGESGAAGLRG
jgi:hypothetical protein